PNLLDSLRLASTTWCQICRQDIVVALLTLNGTCAIVSLVIPGGRTMARKSTEMVALTLRIREQLRRKLERASERNNTSLNAEMANRLEASFQKEAEADLAEQVDILRAENARLSKSLQGWKELPEINEAAAEFMTQWKRLLDDRTYLGRLLALS